jgi:DMSO/TMAO reductase YedYZ molybdopterin-dependent catalytic subunit
MPESPQLPPGQQLVAPGKWPPMGERLPRADDSPWKVQVCGEVAQPRSYSLSELSALGEVEQTVDLHCVTRWSKLGLRFRGVRLATLVAQAHPTEAAKFVSFVARSARGHTTSLPVSDALALHTIVALSADGAPLPTERGGPVRVIVPGRYLYKSLKWLERIELLAADRLGYWEANAGYHNTADPWLEQRYMGGQLSKSEAHAILSSRNVAGRELLSLEAAGRDLAGLDARGAQLRNADFRGCRLLGANFDGANLTNSQLQGANLSEGSLVGADLEGVNFAAADLRGASLEGASFVGASFGCSASDAVIVDSRTRIPRSCLEDLTPDQCELLSDVLAEAGATLV